MRILHQVSHNKNWNIDAYYDNSIGDGFILCAHGVPEKIIGIPRGEHNFQDISQISFLDLQYYGNKSDIKTGNLNTYPFHPINSEQSDATTISIPKKIIEGINYQIGMGFKSIIIPQICSPESINIMKAVNNEIRGNKVAGCKYFMTIYIGSDLIGHQNEIEVLLNEMTDMSIAFDGYYVVYESTPGYKQKIKTDYAYYETILDVFTTLKKQGFEVIYPYANFDSIIISSIVDIDYISIGTFENLKSFTIDRFTQKKGGGPSDGWYFSEKLLNVIRAKDLDLIRRQNCIDIIKNDMNIFSDEILTPTYHWSSTRPAIHKNYLLSITNLLISISSIPLGKDRIEYTLTLVELARENYKKLIDRNVYLLDESSDYHLSTRYSLLKKYSN